MTFSKYPTMCEVMLSAFSKGTEAGCPPISSTGSDESGDRSNAE
jgi:hypothetical protein